MTEVTTTKKKRSKAIPLFFIVVGIALIIAGAIVFNEMMAASVETINVVAKEIKETSNAPHLTEFKVQWASMGFAAATALAGFFVIVGGIIQLFRK